MTGARVIRSRYKIVYNFAWERNTNFSCIWNLFYGGYTMYFSAAAAVAAARHSVDVTYGGEGADDKAMLVQV